MMANYIDELAAWVKKRARTRPKHDRHVVAFLAVRDDVRDAIEAGYAIKTIWAHMNEMGRISYRYETFLIHVNKYIKQTSPRVGKRKAVRIEEDKRIDDTTTELNKAVQSQGFTFDAKPNKEDIV